MLHEACLFQREKEGFFNFLNLKIHPGTLRKNDKHSFVVEHDCIFNCLIDKNNYNLSQVVPMDLEEFANSGFDPKDYVNRLCESHPDGVSLDKYVPLRCFVCVEELTILVYNADILLIMR